MHKTFTSLSFVFIDYSVQGLYRHQIPVFSVSFVLHLISLGICNNLHLLFCPYPFKFFYTSQLSFTGTLLFMFLCIQLRILKEFSFLLLLYSLSVTSPFHILTSMCHCDILKPLYLMLCNF